MTLLICPFDNLYGRMLLEISISMLLALQIIAKKVVVVVVVVANGVLTVALAVVRTYCLLVR